jgi:hypothetical protein
MSRAFDEKQRSRLEAQFIVTLVYLGLLIALTIAFIASRLESPSPPLFLLCVAAGIAGSATGALVSALDRHAHGLEDRDGGATPDPDVAKERFSERMWYWFIMRPWLGGVVAAGVYWGLVSGQWSNESAPPPSPARAAFYGLLVGLFAKSMLDLLRNLPKNIFKQ